MNIGPYTFDEFKDLAARFHGYAAPGLLIGGYMVEKAKAALPQGCLFEAVAESVKCLPDAVQLLTLCSTGNQRLKIADTGRYAVTLYDKYSGEGIRASLDVEKMKAWPELFAWFMKKKPKREQDTALLEQEIREAGDSICNLEKVKIKKRFMGGKHMGSIAVCLVCGEAYPAEAGPVCAGCQGGAPYILEEGSLEAPRTGPKVVPVEDAVGKIAAHDMTRIDPGKFKGPEIHAGQKIEAGDVCRLQRMGRFNVAVEDDGASGASGVHENEAAVAFARLMAGENIEWQDQPHEGKIDFKAACAGLFCVNRDLLRRFNLVPQVMAATRQDATLVKKGEKVAGTRAIPLYLPEKYYRAALGVLEDGPLFEVRPLRKPRVGILVTGTEVFNGLIEDKFIPVISEKIKAFNGEVARAIIVPDDRQAIIAAVGELKDAGIDLLVTTGGLSVDPDDMTRQALVDAGLENIVHGVPVLPGTMSLTGSLAGSSIQVIGVPACALYFKTTFLDLVLPRLLAGRTFTREEASGMGDGGYCLSCKECVYPRCQFGK